MANLVLGIYSPFKYGLKEYEGYNITEFRNNIRFLSVIEDRDNGSAGQICPLFFDGAVSTFNELPLPNNKDELYRVMNFITNTVRVKNTYNFMGFSIRKARVRKSRMSLHKLWRILTFADHN